MSELTYNLADLWEGVVAELGSEQRLVLVIGRDGAVARRFTHRELDERANRLANHLASLGIGPGDRVAGNLYNGPEIVELTLAAFKLRAIPINLNYRYVADELRYVLDDSGSLAVVAEDDLVDRVREARPDLPVIGLGHEYEAALAASSASSPAGPRSSDDLYLLYTGGTTGLPKGVIWRHEDLFFAALGGDGAPRQGWARLDDPDDIGAWARHGSGMARRMPFSPLMHGLGHWTTLTSLLTGGCAVLCADRRFDASATLRLAADEQVEAITLIGDAHLRPVVDELLAHGELYDLSALRMVSSSGAILSTSVQEAFAAALPHVKLINRFGASETASQGRLLNRPGSGESPRLANDGHNVVLDESLRPVQPGTGAIGRLGRSGHIPLGYWNDPEKTAATFPTIDGVRYSVPGDMAMLEDDGTIVVLGRGSMVINSGGEKIFPEEVEAVVKAHPAIFDAVAVGVPDERFGSRVAIVVSLRPGHVAPSVDDLRAHCADRLAAYKMPRSIVVADEIRRSVANKPDYTWARDLATTAL